MSTMARKSGIFHLLVVPLLLLSSSTVLANPEPPADAALEEPSLSSLFGELEGLRHSVDVAPEVSVGVGRLDHGFVTPSDKSTGLPADAPSCGSGGHPGQKAINDSDDPNPDPVDNQVYHQGLRACMAGPVTC